MIRKLLAITAVLTCVGMAASPAQTVVPSSVYTEPERLRPIDGARRLNLYCIRSGQPTVMLEVSSGNSMTAWRHVQAEVASFTRVCA